MSESGFSKNYSLVLLEVTKAVPSVYSLEDAAQHAGVHPDILRYYCRLGLLGKKRVRSDAELLFDDDALYELRRFEHFRRRRGLDRKTLRVLCDLWREVERLQEELRFLRGP